MGLWGVWRRARLTGAVGEVWWRVSLTLAFLDNYRIHYADKETSLSFACLLPWHYIYIYHTVFQQWAFMLINDDVFTDDKAENWNNTHLLLYLQICVVKLSIFFPQNIISVDVILCRVDWADMKWATVSLSN
jgi:hypothetical protein